jgi:hypothetical protein
VKNMMVQQNMTLFIFTWAMKVGSHCTVQSSIQVHTVHLCNVQSDFPPGHAHLRKCASNGWDNNTETLPVDRAIHLGERLGRRNSSV